VRVAVVLALALLPLAPSEARAEWQIKPFVGITFGGNTTFVDFLQAAGSPNFVFGASGMWLGEVIGFEADFGHAPGFFQPGFFPTGDEHLLQEAQPLVIGSGVTTLTGNVVVALPKRMAEYTLRPYLVGGVGMMRVTIDTGESPALDVSSKMPAIDVGGGVTGFLSNRVGLNWELRYFHSVGGSQFRGFSVGAEQLSFWRVNMALAIRY